MELNANKPFQGRYLNDFNQVRFRIFAYAHHTGSFKLIAIFAVEFKTMAMAFLNMRLSICFINLRTFLQNTVVCAQTHRTAHIGYVLLLFHQVDHLIRSVRFHFCRIGILQSHYIAGKFDHHALHTQTDTQTRDIVFTGILQCGKFTFNTTLSESRSNQDSVHIFQQFGSIAVIQFFGMEQMQIQLTIIINSGLQQRFVDRLISILQFDIFTD